MVKTNWVKLSNQAMVYMVASAWQSAEALLVGSFAATWDHDDLPAESLHALCQLVTCWRRLGRKDPVVDGTTRIRRLLEADQCHEPDARLFAIMCLTQESFDAGRYREAREALKSESLASCSDQWILARYYMALGKLALREGDLAEAEFQALDAADGAQRCCCDGALADAYVVLATISKLRGRARESCALYGMALTRYQRAGDHSAIPMVRLNLGLSLGTLGSVVEADMCFERAATEADKLNRSATLLRAHIGRGWCAGRRGHLQRARSILLVQQP